MQCLNNVQHLKIIILFQIFEHHTLEGVISEVGTKKKGLLPT